MLLLLSNTVQNAIIGNDNSLIGGLIGAAALLVINGVVVRTLYHFGKLDRSKGKPDTLIRNGRIMRHHLERELITVAELEAAARKQGIESLAHVQRMPSRDRRRAHLRRRNTRPTTNRATTRLIGLLAQIEVRQRAMLEQIAALERKIAGAAGTTP